MKFGSRVEVFLAFGTLAIALSVAIAGDPTIQLLKTGNHFLTISYVGAKFIAYATWCYWGARWLMPKTSISAMTWGAIRVVVGIAFAFTIGLILKKAGYSSIYSFQNVLVAYLAILIPVRWIEWWLLEGLISWGPWPHLLTRNPGSLRWRCGGIIVSFLADAPMWFATVIALAIC